MAEILRVATFNICGCRGIDGRRDVGRTAETIASLDADCVCIQELNRPLFSSFGKSSVDPIRAIEAAGTRLIFLPTVGGRLGGFGNAVATRLPVLSVRSRMLPSLRERRGVLQVTLASKIGTVSLCCVHFGLNADERRRHADAISAWVGSCETPLAILGDFNESPDGTAVTQLRQSLSLLDAGELSSSPTYPSDHPSARIDLALHSRHLQASRVEVVPSLSSDHLPVVVDFEMG